jgi:hypothetical protein
LLEPRNRRRRRPEVRMNARAVKFLPTRGIGASGLKS